MKTPGAAPVASARGGVVAASATDRHLRFNLGSGGLLADPEDHEFRRLYRRRADGRDDPPAVDLVRRVRLLVAFHEERFLGRPSHQRAVAPDTGEKGTDIPADRLPQPPVVGLEDD